MMQIRGLLRSQLLDAWKCSIEVDYVAQRINSERSLQASFWSNLNSRLDTSNRRMFIEPRMQIKTARVTKHVLPDIVICNSRSVIAVVELKYLPKVRPSFAKDVESLRLISRYRNQIRLSNSRFRGQQQDSKEYCLAKNVLFVWAGIHRGGALSYRSKKTEMISQGIEELEGCFMQLHAETDRSGHPNVFARTN